MDLVGTSEEGFEVFDKYYKNNSGISDLGTLTVGVQG